MNTKKVKKYAARVILFPLWIVSILWDNYTTKKWIRKQNDQALHNQLLHDARERHREKTRDRGASSSEFNEIMSDFDREYYADSL